MSTDPGASGFEPVPHGVPLPDDPEHTEFVHPEAQSLIALVFVILAGILLLLVPVATRAAPMHKGWWVEPATWPIFALSITVAAGGFEALRWVRAGRAARFGADFRQKSLWAFGALGPALKYSAAFIVYLFAVGWGGFALPSFIFMQVVIWMAGLRSTAWKLKAALFVVLVVLVFRVLMGVWFPMAPLYPAFFPDWFVRSVAIYL
ncbi:hypothetical protein IQ03_01593 [Gemmobacter caeni]|uniref:Tripartite tricarboxylate transporter TctB family protein n=1 Tax=Gemmobacter caeni TaxID=589035 RepID=A0A2T6B1U1_9RHOB|nr:hypothetical protein [Gemmobacter caeni]PTX50046.1 hypothetical protein C8N34_106228 [Gemmobacter caeni]TWJ01941.1 hypothetical protein IQ03_01593 [Gemmobacter caeni]